MLGGAGAAGAVLRCGGARPPPATSARRTCWATAAPTRSAPSLGSRRVRRAPAGAVAALAGVVGLTLASEKVSFTKVIEGTRG